jgi:hypothetical protein
MDTGQHCVSVNAPGSYSVGARIESWPGRRLSLLIFSTVFLSLQVNAGILPQIDYGHFLLNSLKFSIHKSYYQSTLHKLDTDIFVKYTRKECGLLTDRYI